MDYNSSVICNAIGYSNLLVYDESNIDGETRSPTKSPHKMRHQHRQYVHQWICIRDIVDGLITCNHILKGKSIHEILSKINLWIKQRHESKTLQLKPTKSESPLMDMSNVKLFKARARQLVWDLMEMK